MAARQPRLYLALLSVLAWSGYAFLGLFPVLFGVSILHLRSLAGSEALAGRALELVSTLSLAAFSAWVSYGLLRFQPRLPDGYEATPEQASGLFELVRELESVYRSPLPFAPAVHRIVLTPECSIGFACTPANGFPLRCTNTLLIGLPLLQTLSAPQFKAALARNVGQLSGRNEPWKAWLYRLRHTWPSCGRVAAMKPLPARWLVQAFFAVYVPLYRHFGAPAAREHEYAGDHYALEQFDAQEVIDSMAAVGMTEVFLRTRLWPCIERMRGKSPEPDRLPFANAEALHQSAPASERKTWMLEMHKAHDGPTSAMPCVRERLERITRSVRLPPLAKESAARRYLGEASLHEAEQWLDQAWRSAAAEDWQQRYRRLQHGQARLRQLLTQAQRSGLSDPAIGECLALAKRCYSAAAALPVYQTLLRACPDNAKLCFAIGRRLLQCNEPNAVGVLEKAMALDERYVVPVCKLISRRRQKHGNGSSAKQHVA